MPLNETPKRSLILFAIASNCKVLRTQFLKKLTRVTRRTGIVYNHWYVSSKYVLYQADTFYGDLFFCMWVCLCVWEC